MPQSKCPFCNPDPARVFLQAELVVGLWDAFPVAVGHALLVTRRHVGSWFDATAPEQQALTNAIQAAREEILRRHTPDGFNLGVNVGRGRWSDGSASPRSRHSAVQR
jgi:diadenosine tetraphosphate (Ap4A) HIT family hydrolase